jgi:hypothetical protein
MSQFAIPSLEVMRDPHRASQWFWRQREQWHAQRAADAESGSDKQAFHEEKRLYAQGHLRNDY